MNSNDIELLRKYVSERSEDAFAELVRQRIGLVYSAALRQVSGDTHLAEEVTQNVFSDLARKAPSLTRHTSLTGWLFTSTRFTATTLRRANQRRILREQDAHAMNQQSNDASWNELRPILDEAMHDLKPDDRDAVLFRFFDHLPLAEVGSRLGVSENAARMRVERALEKLRVALVKRGVTSTAVALAGVLSTHMVGAAPAQLAATVTRTAISSVAAASGFSLLLARLATAVKVKLAVGAAVLAIALVLPLWQSKNVTSKPLENSAADTALTSKVAPSEPPQIAALTIPTASDTSQLNVLHLTVLADDVRKPIPNVSITSKLTKASQSTEQTLVCSPKGVCDVLYPKDIDSIELVTRIDGFADTLLQWEPSKGEPVPTNHTARLVRAMHMGGYVQDDSGAPVAGITLRFRRNLASGVVDPIKQLSHEHREFKVINAITDAHGHWTLDRIAPDMIGRVGLLICDEDAFESKVEFLDAEKQKLLASESYTLTLKRCPAITGTVVDTENNPIPDVDIWNGELGHPGPGADTKTRPDGSFSIKRDLEWATVVSLASKGFVPKVARYELGAPGDSVRIVLERGRALPLEIVDQTGRPVAEAKIFADLEGSCAMPLGTTDQEGKIPLHEAPQSAMALIILASDCRETKLSVPVNGQVQRVTIDRESSVNAIITDASTGRLIPSGRVIIGRPEFVREPVFENGQLVDGKTIRFIPSLNPEDWHKFGSTRFRMSLRKHLDYNADARRGLLLKFEADGYASTISPIIKPGELDIQLEVALRPSHPLKATILNPNGAPALDAEVAQINGVPVTITADRFKTELSSVLLHPDQRGVISAAPDDTLRWVIAINSQGFAIKSPVELASDPILQLQPFGAIQGRWLLDGQPLAGRNIQISRQWGRAYGLILDCEISPAITDPEGRFTFSHLPPGEYVLVAPDQSQPAATSINRTIPEMLGRVQIRPGETTTIERNKTSEPPANP